MIWYRKHSRTIIM